MISRKINKVIIHCSDTKINQKFSARDIDNWHKKRGFREIGYHFYIGLDGKIEEGRNLNEVGAHCKGQNENSIGICFEGGKNEDGSKWDSPLQMQLEAFEALNDYLWFVFQRQLPIHAHNEFSSKTCPNFDIETHLKL